MVEDALRTRSCRGSVGGRLGDAPLLQPTLARTREQAGNVVFDVAGARGSEAASRRRRRGVVERHLGRPPGPLEPAQALLAQVCADEIQRVAARRSSRRQERAGGSRVGAADALLRQAVVAHVSPEDGYSSTASAAPTLRRAPRVRHGPTTLMVLTSSPRRTTESWASCAEGARGSRGRSPAGRLV